jgi:hypothetical protein
MQIRLRCYNCRTPFAVKPDEVIAALNLLHREEHKHYNALCPRCGRANKISKGQLRRAVPNWQPPKETPKPEKTEEKPVKTIAKPKTKTETQTKAKIKTSTKPKAKQKTRQASASKKSTTKTKVKTSSKTRAKPKSQTKKTS